MRSTLISLVPSVRANTEGPAVPPTPPVAPLSKPASNSGDFYAFRFAYRAGGFAGVYVFVPYLMRADGVAIEAPDLAIVCIGGRTYIADRAR